VEGGEGRFNNLQWRCGGVRKGNALNDDNKERGAEREAEAMTDIVLPGDEHICGKSGNNKKESDGSHSLVVSRLPPPPLALPSLQLSSSLSAVHCLCAGFAASSSCSSECECTAS